MHIFFLERRLDGVQNKMDYFHAKGAKSRIGDLKITALEDLESKIDSLQRSNAMILQTQSEIKELLEKRNHLLSEQTLIRRNTGWDS